MNFAEASKEKINLLRAGICLLVLIITAICWPGYRMLREFQTSSDLIVHTYEVLEELETTLSVVEDADTSTRDFVLTKKTESLEPFNHSAEALPEHLGKLRVLTGTDAWQRAKLDRLEEFSEKLSSLAKRTVEQRNKSFAAALRLIRKEEAKSVRQQIRALIGDMKTHEKQFLAKTQLDTKFRRRLNTAVCALLLVSDVALLSWLVVLSFRLNHLQNVIRVCAWTKQVEHEGKWISLEDYLQKMLDAPVTHGICAEAAAHIIAESTQDNERQAG